LAKALERVETASGGAQATRRRHLFIVNPLTGGG
jgi:hypothetical protein